MSSGPLLALVVPFPLLLLHVVAVADAPPFIVSARPERTEPPTFSASMVILVVILLSVFFCLAFFSAYIRFCIDESRQGGGLLLILGGRSRSRSFAFRGIDRAVIETFPVLVYSEVKGVKIGSEALECAICLSHFEDDDALRLLPACSHVFHPDCIDDWLTLQGTCPVCRSNLMSTSPAADAPPTAGTPQPDDETQDEIPLHRAAVEVHASEEQSQELRPDFVVPNLLSIPLPARSKSTRRQLKFLRSHTTGHSIVQPAENLHRFTLRLPEHIRKEIIDGKMKRSTSSVAFGRRHRSVSVGSSHTRL